MEEELAVEKRLLREREELKLREEKDLKKQEDKNENRRLAALKFTEEQDRKREEAKKKAEEQKRRRKANKLRDRQQDQRETSDNVFSREESAIRSSIGDNTSNMVAPSIRQQFLATTEDKIDGPMELSPLQRRQNDDHQGFRDFEHPSESQQPKPATQDKT